MDNSGKTTIILCLQGDQSILSYSSLESTIGVDIQNITIGQLQFNIWELGGQDMLRKDYLSDFKKYGSEVDKIWFVLDVQDQERYEVAVNYFEAIISEFANMKKFPPIYFFLHKFDHNLSQNPAYSNEIINSRIVKKIRSFLPEQFKFSIFKSTIKTQFTREPFFE